MPGARLVRCESACTWRRSGFDLHHTGLGAGRMLVANVPLETGANLLQIEVSHWDRNREDLRPLALIVTEIHVEPVAACDRLARQTSAPEMLASAWGTSRVTARNQGY
jgi:hypothetical protein